MRRDMEAEAELRAAIERLDEIDKAEGKEGFFDEKGQLIHGRIEKELKAMEGMTFNGYRLVRKGTRKGCIVWGVVPDQ